MWGGLHRLPFSLSFFPSSSTSPCKNGERCGRKSRNPSTERRLQQCKSAWLIFLARDNLLLCRRVHFHLLPFGLSRHPFRPARRVSFCPSRACFATSGRDVTEMDTTRKISPGRKLEGDGRRRRIPTYPRDRAAVTAVLRTWRQLTSVVCVWRTSVLSASSYWSRAGRTILSSLKNVCYGFY